MIATRSATRCTSESACEERNTVRPVGGSLARASSSTSSCTSGSRPEVGSSRTSELRPVGKRLDQPDLLPVPLRQRAHRPVEVGVEPLGERVDLGPESAHAAERGEVAHDLAPRQALVEAEVARERRRGDARSATPSRRGSRPSTRTLPDVGRDEVEQEPDRRRLAGAVRPEVAEDLALRDREREVDHAAVGAVALGQPVGDDRVHPGVSGRSATARIRCSYPASCGRSRARR